MTREQMEVEVGRLLAKQRALRRFDLALPPNDALLLERLLYRLGWTKMSRRTSVLRYSEVTQDHINQRHTDRADELDRDADRYQQIHDREVESGTPHNDPALVTFRENIAKLRKFAQERREIAAGKRPYSRPVRYSEYSSPEDTVARWNEPHVNRTLPRSEIDPFLKQIDSARDELQSDELGRYRTASTEEVNKAAAHTIAALHDRLQDANDPRHEIIAEYMAPDAHSRRQRFLTLGGFSPMWAKDREGNHYQVVPGFDFDRETDPTVRSVKGPIQSYPRVRIFWGPNGRNGSGFDAILHPHDARRIVSGLPEEVATKLLSQLDSDRSHYEYLHPDGHNRPAGASELLDQRERMSRRPRRYAKADTRHEAHPLIAGFPIEHALRHMANDASRSDTVRELSKRALTTGDTSALWGLHDAVQEDGKGVPGGYNLMSAADKIGLDAHTRNALEIEAADSRVGVPPEHHGAHTYSPEHHAERAESALSPGDARRSHTLRSNRELLDRIRARVARAAPGADSGMIDESIRRHAHRARLIAHQRTTGGGDDFMTRLYQENALRHHADASTGDPEGRKTVKATRYRRRPLRYSAVTVGPGEAADRGHFVHHVTDPSGNRVASVRVKLHDRPQGGKSLWVYWVGRPHGVDAPANSLGGSATRAMYRQLVDHYPEATHMAGSRISGFREGGDTRSQEVERPIPGRTAPQPQPAPRPALPTRRAVFGDGEPEVPGGEMKPRFARKAVRYAKAPRPTYTDLVTHAGRVLDNPMDNTAFMAFADHLLENHPDNDTVRKFIEWTQGGNFRDMVASLRTARHRPHGPLPNRGPETLGIDDPDLEIRDRQDGSGFARGQNETYWHRRVKTVGRSPRTENDTVRLETRRIRGPKLTAVDVAHHVYTQGGPESLINAVVGARYYHPARDGDKGGTVDSVRFARKTVRFDRVNRMGTIDALRHVASKNHTALLDSARDVARRMGIEDTHVLPALHDAPGGAVPGVAQAVYGPVRPESVHELAAWVNGLLPNSPGYSVFHPRQNGPDTLYRMRHEGSGMDVRARLDRAGIEQRVMIPHRRGFDVLVPDKGNKLAKNVEEYVARHGVPLEASPGHFQTVGAADQGDARSKFRDKVVEGERSRMSRTRPRRYAARKPRQKSGVFTPEQAAILSRAASTGDKAAWGALGDHLAENGHAGAGAVLSAHATGHPESTMTDDPSTSEQLRPGQWRYYYAPFARFANHVLVGRHPDGNSFYAAYTDHDDKPTKMRRGPYRGPRRYTLDVNETIRQGIANSRRQQRGQGYVQDANAGKVLADALDEADQPHAPFFRSLVPMAAGAFEPFATEHGNYSQDPADLNHPVRADVTDGNHRFVIRPVRSRNRQNNPSPPAVYVNRTTPGRFAIEHTAVLNAPALREWAAHPKVGPSLRAALVNAADHLDPPNPTQLSRRRRTTCPS